MNRPPPQPLVLIGAGAHAREVLQIVRDINAALGPQWNPLGCLIEFGPPPDPVIDLPVLGPPAWLHDRPEVAAVLAIGQPAARQRLAQQLGAHSHWATLIHPSVWCAAPTGVHPGAVIFPGSRLSVGVSVGSHAIVHLGCNLSHDVSLAAFAQLGPGVSLAGGVQVEEGAELGAGVSARPRTRIGARAIIGAGAAVIGPIPPGTVAAGVPARALAPQRPAP